MKEKQYPSDKQDKFMLRFPEGMRELIKNEADSNGRSMNAEIVYRLEQSLGVPKKRLSSLVEDIASPGLTSLAARAATLRSDMQAATLLEQAIDEAMAALIEARKVMAESDKVTGNEVKELKRKEADLNELKHRTE